MYLIDTSVWIDYFRPKTTPKLKERVRDLLESGSVITCGIVLVELLRGAKTLEELKILDDALFALPQIPLDEPVLRRAAQWGYGLDRKGHVLPTTDLIIASAAFPFNRLIHRDKDFITIADNFGLKHEYIAEKALS